MQSKHSIRFGTNCNKGVTYCVREVRNMVFIESRTYIITSDYLLPELIDEWTFTHDSREIPNVLKFSCFVCAHLDPRVITRATHTCAIPN